MFQTLKGSRCIFLSLLPLTKFVGFQRFGNFANIKILFRAVVKVLICLAAGSKFSAETALAILKFIENTVLILLTIFRLNFLE